MTNKQFSFIILTFNEELHLPRLLNSLKTLNAATFVLDSGSTDLTLDICKEFKTEVLYNFFENHPKQWDFALTSFQIDTPWVICLDADQIISPELLIKLEKFRDQDYRHIDGIYFNRKNYFKGKWIRYGGYYPKYLLKMFRYKRGYSDLTEMMDHKFQVHSNTIIWKDGHLIEENLKENKISFWIEKHNIYSDLLAEEEMLRQNHKTSIPLLKPDLWGSPNQKVAWQKNRWRNMPLYVRAVLYFLHRMIFQRGILDGKTGFIFHFLQSFWFRLIVDIKIEERLNSNFHDASASKHKPAYLFLCTFIGLFSLFYLLNLTMIGLTNPDGYYIEFFNKHLNYIKALRHFLINSTKNLLENLGYKTQITDYKLKVENHAGFKIVYSCLGLNTCSLFSAFVISFPKPLYSRLIFLISGLLCIQLLNIIRLTLISIYYRPHTSFFNIDHHSIFNLSIYSSLIVAIYFWINQQTNLKHENYPIKKRF